LLRREGRARSETVGMSRRERERLRVLILVQNLPVPFDRRVWQEALALTAAGYEVHVVCPRTEKYPERREFLNDIHIYRYSPGPEARRSAAYLIEYTIAVLAQLRLALAIRFRRRIDVVHICNPPDLLFLVALPLVASGARLIYDHHDATPELMVAKGMGENGLLVRLVTLFERLTYRFAQVSIETNDSFRDIALRRGGMSPEDVFVVRSAPDVKRFAKAEPDEIWRRGRKHLVAYVGIMGSQDGLDYLIDAANLIIQDRKRDDIQFVLVGGGPELPRLRERVNFLDLGAYVEFTGLISSGTELGTILATADVCVSPDEANRMNDISTMNKIVEYMALGKPIVQFDLHEGRVSAGEASLYAKRNDVTSLADGIIQLVDDSEMAARMGQIGRQRLVTTLSWELQIPKLLGAYERALRKQLSGFAASLESRSVSGGVADLAPLSKHVAGPERVPVQEFCDYQRRDDGQKRQPAERPDPGALKRYGPSRQSYRAQPDQ
jgi:glycosyltransferase involved in cell wall biosynthesis